MLVKSSKANEVAGLGHNAPVPLLSYIWGQQVKIFHKSKMMWRMTELNNRRTPYKECELLTDPGNDRSTFNFVEIVSHNIRGYPTHHCQRLRQLLHNSISQKLTSQI